MRKRFDIIVIRHTFLKTPVELIFFLNSILNSKKTIQEIDTSLYTEQEQLFQLLVLRQKQICQQLRQ